MKKRKRLFSSLIFVMVFLLSFLIISCGGGDDLGNKSDNASVSSASYTVDNSAETIINIPTGTSLADFESNVTPAAGASFDTYESDGITVATDLASGYKIIVTAEDGVTKKTYTLTISAPLTDTDITAFSFAEQTGAATIDSGAHTVAIEVSNGTDPNGLVATFTLSTGATAEVSLTAQTSGTTSNDFTGAVTYKITAQDGTTTQDWTITVTVAAALSTETDITAFSFTEQTSAATINSTTHTVDIEVVNGTDPNGLVATFTLSTGATSEVSSTVQTSGTTSNDFTGAVTYTITAQDGTTTQDWTVTVTVAAALSTETDITAFSFTEQTGAATINSTAHTVDIEVVSGTERNGLVATFTLSTGATAEVSSTSQTSGTTSNDFTNAVTYTVTAQDGSTTQDWTITVTVGISSETDITAFSFTEQAEPAVINSTTHTVDIKVLNGTAMNSLIATFTLSNGATAEVSSTSQTSGSTSNDFSSAVTYTITAEDSTTTQNWTVTVTEASTLNGLLINEWAEAGTGITYIEIKNFGTTPVSITDSNFMIKFGSSQGTTVTLPFYLNDGENDPANKLSTSGGVSIASGELILIVDSDVTSTNVGSSSVSSTTTLRGFNGFNGKIFLSTQSTLIGGGDRLSDNFAFLEDDSANTWSQTPAPGDFSTNTGTSTYSYLNSAFRYGTDSVAAYNMWGNGSALSGRRTAGFNNLFVPASYADQTMVITFRNWAAGGTVYFNGDFNAYDGGASDSITHSGGSQSVVIIKTGAITTTNLANGSNGGALQFYVYDTAGVSGSAWTFTSWTDTGVTFTETDTKLNISANDNDVINITFDVDSTTMTSYREERP